MESLVDNIVKNLQVTSLDRQTADEALFYLNSLYNKTDYYPTALNLMKIKIKVLRRIVELDKAYLAEIKLNSRL